MRQGKISRGEKKTIKWFFLFVSPWIIGFLLFTALPMGTSFLLSFTDCKVATISNKPLNFIGLWNFKYLFTKDSVFFQSIGNTFYYALLRVGLGLIISLLLALLYNKKLKGKKLMRTLIYAPSLIPVTASSLLWKLLLTQENSIVSNLLSSLGVANVNFLSPALAMPTVVFVSLMGGVGSTMIILLAALQTVPKELQESAQLDGAGSLRVFWHITIPMISPSIMFTTITGLIGALQAYANIKLFTAGGPLNKTTTMTMEVVKNAFAMDVLSMGYACAEAWIVFVIVVIFSGIYFKMMKKRIYYGD